LDHGSLLTWREMNSMIDCSMLRSTLILPLIVDIRLHQPLSDRDQGTAMIQGMSFYKNTPFCRLLSRFLNVLSSHPSW
jgi:hypothetical protein